MKVIFRVTKDMPDKAERVNFAKLIRNAWEETKDLGCMVCFGDDVEVYVVSSDSEIEVEDNKSELFNPETTFDDLMKMVMGGRK